MNKGSNNSIICNEVNQAIKREPSACKISGQTPVCEAGRPSVSESSQDAVVGVSNYQGSRPINSSVTNTYHHVGDKCIQVSSTTLDSSYPQVGSIDSRTLTVNSSYHSNVTGNGRPVTSAVEYHHSTNGNSRAAVSVNSVYHNSGGGSTNNNIAPSYQHNTSGSSGGGNGGVNVVTSGTVNLPSNYQESSGGSGISSSYHLHHGSGVVPCNGGTMGQVNAPPGYYYTPILNSQQTLLRPIMAAQPPLYSPLLTPQQHTYPMPHASPSAGMLHKFLNCELCVLVI
ncbi:probable ATP-dependent RNA helicase ddx17 [Palaemon carinicauda]|uniref:probable ATP-dependent RNA helicase ddx17 n=1 Tax=Palaemon carinicauda TaxID=392227 RepID=UPI0035B5F5FA